MLEGPGGGSSVIPCDDAVDRSAGVATSVTCVRASIRFEGDDPRRVHPSIVSFAVSVALIGTPSRFMPTIVRLV